MTKKDWMAMIKRGRLAIVNRSGRSLTVIDKEGVAWKLYPASGCTWAAVVGGSGKKKLGFGDSIFEAIKDAKGK